MTHFRVSVVYVYVEESLEWRVVKGFYFLGCLHRKTSSRFIPANGFWKILCRAMSRTIPRGRQVGCACARGRALTKSCQQVGTVLPPTCGRRVSGEGGIQPFNPITLEEIGTAWMLSYSFIYIQCAEIALVTVSFW